MAKAIVTIKANEITEKNGHYGCLYGQISRIVSDLDKTGWIQTAHHTWDLPNGNRFSVACAVIHFQHYPGVNYRDQPKLKKDKYGNLPIYRSPWVTV